MQIRAEKNRAPRLAIFVGTELQKRILVTLYPELVKKIHPSTLIIISLDSYYQFDLNLNEFDKVKNLAGFFKKPWYNRGPLLKLLSLFLFVWQILRLSYRCSHFLFFVDTGLIERTAITLLNLLNRRTAVLQDAMKRQPRQGEKRSLSWFGDGNADLYMLIGERYISMIRRERSEVKVVGSPIYSNEFVQLPPGKKILVFNQCFACYGETSEEVEYNFIRQVVEKASIHGPVELRLHPHNDPHLYKRLASDKIDVTYRKSLSSSLQEAGIVLAINSSAILESLASARPVLTLDWHPSPFRHLIKTGITRCADIDQMVYYLEKWEKGALTPEEIGKKNSRELIAHIAYSGPEAINRITDEIIAFMQKIENMDL